jgi:hypothetical protein
MNADFGGVKIMKYVIIYKLYGGPTEFLVYDNYESIEEKEDF